MVLSEEGHILIKHLYYFKGYGAKRLICEFPTKGRKKTTVNDFLKRLKETGSTMWKSGSRRPRTVITVANISAVNDLVLNQEDAPLTHCSTRQIARETGTHRSFVVWIIRDEWRLKCVKKCHAQELTEANCITRLSNMKKLLSKFPESAIDFIIFTVALPVNLHNDRLYTPCGTCATLLPTVCFPLGRHSASLSWCLSHSQNLDALNWSLWSREWR